MGSGFSCDVSGRTVLITGASSGLGAGFARGLAANGARVVLCARRTELLGSLAAEIAGAGGEAVAVGMDVTCDADTIAAYEAAEAAFGPVDSVIANAGVAGLGKALEITTEAFDHVVAVNLRGVFLTVREGARRMIAARSRERRHGRIVIISSVTAAKSSRAPFAYCATKAAVTRMGELLAREWAADGININMLSPGHVLTDLTASALETPGGRRMIERFPRARLLDQEELLPLLLYLASDASSGVTGASFTVDDGQTL